MQQAVQIQSQDQQLTWKEKRAAAKLARQQARETKRQTKKDKAAATVGYDLTKTDPDSFYERAIEWTHRADKIINLFLGYALAVASVLGFMDVLSNGEVLGHVPFLFYAWLLIMGLGVDFQILLVIGRVPDLARMVNHGIGKWILIIFNIVFLVFLAYVSIVIGAVFTQHRDVPGTIAQAMQVLNINTVNFVYERAALATFLLILMAVDRTMERWRMQMAASNKQQARDQVNTAQVSTVEGEQGNTAPAPQSVDLTQILASMQEINAQNLAAMQRMSDESMSRFSKVTIEMVRETVERTAATIAIQAPVQQALPPRGVNSEGEQDRDTGELVLPEEPERGKQEANKNYGPEIEQLYINNPDITTTEIEEKLGCTRKTASKHLQRLRPVVVTEQG